MRKNFYPHHLENEVRKSYLKFLFPLFDSLLEGVLNSSNPFIFLSTQLKSIQVDSKTKKDLYRTFDLLNKHSQRQIIDSINRLKGQKRKQAIERISLLSRYQFREIRSDSLRMDAFPQSQEDVKVGDLFRVGLNDDYIKSTVENNVNLIGKAYEEHYQVIRDVIEDGIKTGKTTDEIAKILTEKTGIAKRKAEFWAQDQTSKYYGEITKYNQTSAGFDGFIWRSVRDARVRDTHRELEGKFFLWSKGTEISGREFPGRDYRCRCFAEPEFKDDYSPSVEATYKAQANTQRERIIEQTGFGLDVSLNPINENKIKISKEDFKNAIQEVSAIFISKFNIDKENLSKTTFRSMTQSDLDRLRKLYNDPKLYPSGFYDSIKNEIVLSITETNPRLTTIHEMTHLLTDKIGFYKIQNDPIFKEILSIYKKDIPSHVPKYFLQDNEIFSRLMEMYISDLSGGNFYFEMENKIELYKSKDFGSLIDKKKYKKLKPILDNLLKNIGILK